MLTIFLQRRRFILRIGVYETFKVEINHLLEVVSISNKQ